MTTCASTPSIAHSKRLHVAVGVLCDQQGKVLLSQRTSKKTYAGVWEFPGGKVEPGESMEEALDREFSEELGLRVRQAYPLIRINHDYPEYPVLLDVWRVTEYDGKPKGLEGQSIRWVEVDNLEAQDLLPANQPIVRAIQLPPLYAIIDGDHTAQNLVLERMAASLSGGTRLFQLRAHTLPEGEYGQLTERVLTLAQKNDALLLLNSAPQQVIKFGAHGLHLSSRRLLALANRPLSNDYSVAASCHNLAELEHAERIGIDFAVLSPVRFTPTHPQASPLGWDKFKQLCEIAKFPVYALGGMNSDDISKANKNGAQGLAMISGLWQAPDIEAVARSIMEIR